jgi:segregation and condensation protein B
MNEETLKSILEAALMASPGALTVGQLLALFEGEAEQPDKAGIRRALELLVQDYEGRGIELAEVASGYRFQVCGDYARWVDRLQEERPQRYSRALLETLAIIAYRQPITRGEIEDIRGVSVSSNIIRTLQEREWIRVVGHRDVPGKPELLATTREFLDYFNLRKLSDLPPLSEIKDFDKINPDLFESLEKPQQEVEAEVGQGEPGAGEEPGEESGTSDGEAADLIAEDNVVPFTGQS